MELNGIGAEILRYCKYQERCHKEVRSKLYKLGYGKDAVDDQMVLLIEKEVLNEERFARAYARGKFNLLKWGRKKIAMQLRLKGISEYLIKKALSEIDPYVYEQVLDKLARNKAFGMKGRWDIIEYKVKMFLLQKGYETDMISIALQKIEQQ